MPLDSVENHPAEEPDERGPAVPQRRVVVADADRLYRISESSSMLVREGERVPQRLVGLPYTGAKIVDGVFVPYGKARK